MRTFTKILGIIILIGGISLLFISHYITEQVAQGKLQISEAEEKVDTGKQLFGMTPLTKQIGRGVTGSAEKKINSAKQEVGYYTELAGNLQTGGVALIVAGALVFGVAFLIKKRR